jgi:hypothetical protein
MRCKLAMLFCISTVLTVLLTSCRTEGAENGALVTFITGKVLLVDSNGTERQLAVGEQVESGQKVITAIKSSCELQFAVQGVVRVKPDSTLVIADYTESAESTIIDLDLISGSLLAQSEDLDAGSSFTVSTESITAGVRGTEFTVKKDGEKSGVFVGEGKVAVKRNYSNIDTDEVRSIDPEIGEKLAVELEQETFVEADSKLVVSAGDATREEAELEEEITRIKKKLERSEPVDDTDIESIRKSRKTLEAEKMTREEKEQWLPEKDYASMRQEKSDKRDDTLPLTLVFEGIDTPVTVFIDDSPVIIVRDECTLLYSRSKTPQVRLEAESYNTETLEITADMLQGETGYTITVPFTIDYEQKKSQQTKKNSKIKKGSSSAKGDLLGEYSTVESFKIEVELATGTPGYSKIRVEALYNFIEIRKISFYFSDEEHTKISDNVELYPDKPGKESRELFIPRETDAELELIRLTVTSEEDPGEDTVLKIYGIR